MSDITHLRDLTPDPKNARRHNPRNVGMVVDALHEVGAARSIVIDEFGVVLAGNATIEAAGQAGIERVQVVDADGDTIIAVRRSGLTSKQKKRLALFDNRAAELADWDVPVLLDEPDLLAGLFREDEQADLLASLVEPKLAGAGGDEFDTTPADGPTRVQPGDVWRVGQHRIGCIDSTDVAAVERLLAGDVPSMVWADPPYGIDIVDVKGYVGGGAAYDIPFGGVKNRKPQGLGSADGAKPFGSKETRGTDGAPNMVGVGYYAPVIGDDTTETAINGYKTAYALCPQAIHFWWGANYYADILPPSSCWIVWDKENTGNFADAELAWCSDKSAVRIFRHMWNGLMKASERGDKRVHPTQKPVALALWAFEKYGKRGDIIFDPFLGSAPSLIAAERTGRRVAGAELSAAYCDVILRRAEAEGIAPIERIS